MNKPLSIIAHLVPSGTPLALMPFMVLIESIRTVIRPITLSVRLAANMIAGHLLLSLCGGGFLSMVIGVRAFIGQTLLFRLEIAVALIQSYVFITLVTLYSRETC